MKRSHGARIDELADSNEPAIRRDGAAHGIVTIKCTKNSGGGRSGDVGPGACWSSYVGDHWGMRVYLMSDVCNGFKITFVSEKHVVEDAVADPGFPRGGGANFPGGCQHMILPNFIKNCMKLKEFGPPEGAHPLHPP